MRDTFDRFARQERGLFGDNEQNLPRINQIEKRNRVDLTLVLRRDAPLSIAVTQTEAANEKWIFLPKALIHYRKLSATAVEVSIPDTIARDKGLI